MEKTMIGFDIGSDRLKIAVAKNDAMELHEIRLPERMVENGVVKTPNAFSDYLKKLRKDLDLPRAKAALVVPSGQAICRLVTMPRMTEDQLLLNLPYEFSDFIHGEPERYYCDYALCEELEGENVDGEDPRMTMMAAIIAKEQSYDYIRMFAQAGIKLDLLLPQEMCLLQIAENHRRQSPAAPREYCFVDLGYTGTRVTVISGDRVQAVRQINAGGETLDRIVAEELGVDPFVADTYIRKNYRNILEHPRCMDLYGNIAVELLKVFNFYQYAFRNNNLEGIYLIGGGANNRPLRRVIADTLSVPLYAPEELFHSGVSVGMTVDDPAPSEASVPSGVSDPSEDSAPSGASDSADAVSSGNSTSSGSSLGEAQSRDMQTETEASCVLAAGVALAKGAKK